MKIAVDDFLRETDDAVQNVGRPLRLIPFSHIVDHVRVVFFPTRRLCEFRSRGEGVEDRRVRTRPIPE